MNLTALINTLKRKYPFAFDEFNKFKPNNETFPYFFDEFITSFGLKIFRRLTIPLNQNFNGTYSYRIEIGDENSKKLVRKIKNFSYYGIKSEESAIEKSIEKSFQIINCLISGKPLVEKARVV